MVQLVLGVLAVVLFLISAYLNPTLEGKLINAGLCALALMLVLR